MLSLLSVAALVFIPGTLVLRCARVPWQWSVGLAPGVTLLVTEVIATSLYVVGLPFSRVSAGVGLLVVIAAAWLAGRALPTKAEAAPPIAGPRATYLGVACGLVLLALPLMIGMGSLTTLMQQWDGVFHLSSIRAVRDHSIASSLWGLAPLYPNGAPPVFYPSALVGLISLAPGQGVEVLNAAVYVFGVLVWAAGLLLLAAAIEQRHGARLGIARGRLLGWILPVSAAFVTIPAVLFPLLSAIPYAAASVLLPAVLAGFVMRENALRLASGVAALGMVITHPISVASLALVAGPFVVIGAARFVPRAWAGAYGARGKVAVGAGIALAFLAIAGYWFVTSRVRGYQRGRGANFFGELGSALIDFTPLWQTNDWYLGGLVLGVLSIIGLAMIWKRCPTWVAGAVTTVWVSALLLRSVARIDVAWLQILATPWYSQAARIAPVLTLIGSLLVAIAIACLLGSRGWRYIMVAAVGFAVVTGGWRTPARAELVAAAYQAPEIAYGTMVDADDLEVLNWLKDNGLPDSGALVGDPANGAAFAYGYSGVNTIGNQLTTAVLPKFLRSALLDFSNHPEYYCELLKQNGVSYIYVDSDTAADGAKVSEKAQGIYGVDTTRWQLMTRSGSVSVWKLPDRCRVQ